MSLHILAVRPQLLLFAFLQTLSLKVYENASKNLDIMPLRIAVHVCLKERLYSYVKNTILLPAGDMSFVLQISKIDLNYRNL